MPVTQDGQRTARDLLIEGMTTQGISEVPCVEFQFNDGAVVNVLTDQHPSLSRPASDVSSMKFKSSAEAGGEYRAVAVGVRINNYFSTYFSNVLNHIG